MQPGQCTLPPDATARILTNSLFGDSRKTIDQCPKKRGEQ